MSKGGGAGKVYFILYLAVLLELLIIIVERDDAEEELKKEKLALEQKSKRIQLIAETIINALRGSKLGQLLHVDSIQTRVVENFLFHVIRHRNVFDKELSDL